jgi:carbamate kinase
VSVTLFLRQKEENLLVVALGGNALLQRGESGSFQAQYRNVTLAVKHIADIIEANHKVVITHGNGPQVGATVLRHEAGFKSKVPSFPLDVCGAETQGFIGYMIQQALTNELTLRGRKALVVTLVTRVTVEPNDPAFKTPTKPIGTFYTAEQAEELMRIDPLLVIKEDSGRGYRRLVPSPDPITIIEKDAIIRLVNEGYVVVSCGGGGIPVVRNATGHKGVEAVIDKDLAGERLATLIGASKLMVLTDVDGAYLNYGKPDQKKLGFVKLSEINKLYAEGHFAVGSMGPKVLASIRFVTNGGDEAIICTLNEATRALTGEVGTHIQPG